MLLGCSSLTRLNSFGKWTQSRPLIVVLSWVSFTAIICGFEPVRMRAPLAACTVTPSSNCQVTAQPAGGLWRKEKSVW